MLITLTKLRNNLFNIADQVSETNKPVFVGKNGKMDMVVLSFEQYKDLEKTNKKEEKENKTEKDIKSLLKFAGAGKNTKFSKMNDEEFQEEFEKIKYKYFLDKHTSN